MSETSTVTVGQTDLAKVLLWVTVSGAPSVIKEAAKRLREELEQAE